ncbi:hypothetical protein AMJ85_02665 [candidate division BRC1 bacterium SM23_51]|nr:MAG: hypothetical protein AMJ85_02665 [candidate division BRC1 bacterium SM23_51]
MELRDELFEHLPFTVFSVAAGMAVLGFMTYGAMAKDRELVERGSRSLFHVFHPLHMLFSATATTAMFWRHERRWLKAIVIGVIGSLGVCGLSDIFLPYVSGFLLGVRMQLHVCIIEHPQLILPYVLVGLAVGFILSPTTRKGTIFSHSAHVVVSSMASLLYLVSYGLHDWVSVGGLVLIYMVLAVMLPCCTSDIVFPLLLISEPADKAKMRAAFSEQR